MTILKDHTKHFQNFFWIHLVTSIFAVILLIWLASCTKDPEKKKAELGPKVTVSEVDNALKGAMGGRTPLETKVGDQALYEVNQRIESGDVTVLQDLLLQVKEREENEHFIIYRLDQTSVSYEKKEPDTVRTELEWKIAKVHLPELPPTRPLDTSTHPLRLDRIFHPSVFSEQYSPLEKEIPVTFHNLQVIKTTRAVPPGVAADSQCRHLNPCQLNVTEVNFDLVEWPSPDNWKTSQYRYIYSPDTPFPAHLILLCVKQLVDAGQRDYFVSQCQMLRDFLAGSQ